MTADPLALDAAELAANWPYSIMDGRKWRLQTGAIHAVTGEVVAIHAVSINTNGEHFYVSPSERFFFLRTEGGGLAIVPERCVFHYWRDSTMPPFEGV